MKIETSQELFNKTAELQLYEKLLAQIQKDFNRANIQLRIKKTITGHQLVKIIQEKVYVLLLENFDDYLNLMYVIDIPEKKIKKIKDSNVIEVSKGVAFLILKREFQKVWYKSKNS